jgi:hypothetical protein
MTQVAAKIFERVHLIVVDASTRNQSVAQCLVTTRHLSENWRLLGTHFVVQVIGYALHPRTIVLEALTGLTARGSGQQTETTSPSDPVDSRGDSN